MHQYAEKSRFKNPQMLTCWVRYSLYAQIALAIIFIAMEILGVNNGRSGVAAVVLYWLISIISAITILSWIYRANYNIQQLGARDLDFSPTWSIGYYFIPIFNIRQPYLAMTEIWKASSSPNNWQEQKTPALLWMWWSAWLISGLLFDYSPINASFDAYGSAIREINCLVFINHFVEIILALFFLTIVNAIHDMQINLHLQSVAMKNEC